MRFLKAVFITGFLLVICSTLAVSGESRVTLIQCLLVYLIILRVVFFKDLNSSNPLQTKKHPNSLTKNTTPGRHSQKSTGHLTFSYQDHNTRFVEQAKAYAQLRGKPTKHIPFQSYYSTYGDMNQSQKSWYFYWRTQVRQGIFPDTSLSYIFVYVYELINNVGVVNSEDGVRKLRTTWLSYRERHPQLNSYLAEWLLDYITVNLSSEYGGLNCQDSF